MAYSEDPAVPVAEQLIECAVDQLTKRGIAIPGKRMVQPGLTPVLDWVGGDKCTDCEELIAWVENVYPIGAAGFPEQDDTGSCSSGLAFVLHVGIYRRALALQGTAQTPPTPAQQTASAYAQGADREALRKAILCCAQSTGRRYVLGAYTSYGPEGLAVGGDWTVTFGDEA